MAACCLRMAASHSQAAVSRLQMAASHLQTAVCPLRTAAFRPRVAASFVDDCIGPAGRSVLPAAGCASLADSRVSQADSCVSPAGNWSHLQIAASRMGTTGSTCGWLHILSIFMVFGWWVFGSFAILLSRFAKHSWPNVKLCGTALWFQLHRAFMITSILLQAVAFIFVFVQAWSFKTCSYSCNTEYYNLKLHTILGIICTVAAVIQPLLAMLRPMPSSPKRPIFNWSHWLIGTASWIIAWNSKATMMLNHPDSYKSSSKELSVNKNIFIRPSRYLKSKIKYIQWTDYTTKTTMVSNFNVEEAKVRRKSFFEDIHPDDKSLHDFFLEKFKKFGTCIAFVNSDNNKKVTYIELYELCHRLAAGLRQHDLTKGDRVTVCLPNCPEFATVVLGVALAGGVPSPINPAYTIGV
uniref:Cytochrome b561 domain-containing protein n=1 Tax=Romanomermis culicivorax TaxID=13658 RepID=A0A915I2N6_ROMCU